MALTSLKPQTEVFRVPPTFLPAAWTLEHYVSLFRLTDFGLLFMNSLKVCLLSTVFALLALRLWAASRNANTPAESRRTFVVGTASFVAALTAKSVALVLPFWIAMYELILRRSRTGR